MKLSILYRGVARCTIGDGPSVSFWDDLWASDILSVKYPHLFSFATNPEISVKQIVLTDDLYSLFNLPLSPVAFEELLDLHDYVQNVDFDLNSKDRWFFLWGNQVYSSRRYYKMVFQSFHPSLIFKKVWKSKCTTRLKFFAWLMFVDWLNTRNMLV